MVPDLHEINGIDNYDVKQEKSRTLYQKNGKTFLVQNLSTIEVRCDKELGRTLQERYESVMQSRYFGHGGIEIVPTHQLTKEELADLIRLSYELTDK
ncbi:MmcQ/YjbR family DNA-binding protein [Candidatus Saccharibacteria bacterium]|nr:MmcQ/YjbR family DNA-binding protein [Candidatus Saccharibacteria bacterium]